MAWPAWLPESVVATLAQTGVTAPWSHQVQAAELARAGKHVVISTGTASGKSLAYQLPVLAALTEDPRATALYLAPTKALGADQLRSVAALGGAALRAASFDGDTPLAERDWARAHARWLITNPDMLHYGVLPRHGRWAPFLRRLRYVVLDECHGYRGVFGSHVALLIRRLRRVCARYGSAPVFVLASATVAEPDRFASRLTGLDVTAVTADGSPRSARTVALWEPPLLEPSVDNATELGGPGRSPVRRSAGAEAARMMADLVLDGARVLTFVRSRRGAELTALAADRAIAEVDAALAGRVSAYRGGFLPEERRALEQALRSGELLGVATTNALELGVDIVGLDAVLMAGFPGTRASFWQQAGRAGRGGRDALIVLLASDDPLDTYLVHHPDALLGAPVESCVLDPANPYVLAPQLACAAAELPLTDADLATVFDDPRAVGVLDDLVAQGVLRRRPGGWFWPTPRERPAPDVDIRGSGGGQVLLVETETSRMLGTVEVAAAPAAVHPGAVYLHRGESYVVDELDLSEGLAQVHAEEPAGSTSAR
ncbi:MAG: box helicase [Pseudonocardia sp.]|nr:box helicase [Pseudonocardia sp.]